MIAVRTIALLAAVVALAPRDAGAEPEKKKEPPMSKPVSPEVQKAIDTAVAYDRPIAERRAALDKLVELADPAAVIPLTSLLDGNEGSEALVPDVRVALGKLNASAVLVGKLSSPKVEDKTLALELLGMLGDKSALEPVMSEASSMHKEVREKAAVALGRFNDQRAVSPLSKALGDPEADVRMAAAYSLGFLGGAEAKRSLEDALKAEKDGFVKIAIEKGLEQANQKR